MIWRMRIRRSTGARIAAFVLPLILTAVFVTTQWMEPTPTSARDLPPGTTIINGTDGSMTPQGAADPHMRMTPQRSATSDDRARTNQLAQQLRRSLTKYRDVRSAEEAGYKLFPPRAENLKVLHYVNPWLSYLESWRIDPEQPGSLLYERQSDGSLRLLGAMLTAPEEATPKELDKRVPTSTVPWHMHVNLCLPEPLWDEEQWAREQNGRPVFGPQSPIATEDQCEAVGGKFAPTVFGWMVHMNVFANNSADNSMSEPDQTRQVLERNAKHSA